MTSPIQLANLTPAQRQRYLQFFPDSLEHLPDRIYTYHSPTVRCSFPLISFLKECWRKMSSPPTQEIALKGGAVYHVLQDKLLKLSDCNIDISPVPAEVSLDTVERVFSQALQGIIGQPVTLQDRSMHWLLNRVLVQDAENEFSIFTLPTLREGVPQPINIAFVKRRQSSCFGSSDCCKIDLMPIIQPLAKLDSIPLQVKTVDGYDIQEAFALMDLRQFTVKPLERVALLKNGMRGYCRLLSRGFYPNDPAIENAFCSKFLSEQKTMNPLSVYLQKHYANDRQGQIIYLLNQWGIFKRSALEKKVRQTMEELLFQPICDSLGVSKTENIRSFFRYAICYLYLRSSGKATPMLARDWPAQHVQFSVQRGNERAMDNHFLFVLLPLQTIQTELRNPSEFIVSHPLLVQLAKQFPHDAENLTEFFQKRVAEEFPEKPCAQTHRLLQLLEEPPNKQCAEKLSLFLSEQQTLSPAEQTAVTEKIIVLWRSLQPSNILCDLLKFVPDTAALLKELCAAKNWTQVVTLYKQRPDPTILQLIAAQVSEQKVPIEVLFDLLFAEKNPKTTSLLVPLFEKNREPIKQFLLGAPPTFARTFLSLQKSSNADLVKALFECFHRDLCVEDGVLSPSAILACQEKLPMRGIAQLYSAIEPDLIASSEDLFLEIFTSFFTILYPKHKTQLANGLVRLFQLPKSPFPKILEHLAKHPEMLAKDTELMNWFLTERTLLQNPSDLIQRAVGSSAPSSPPAIAPSPIEQAYTDLSSLQQNSISEPQLIRLFFRISDLFVHAAFMECLNPELLERFHLLLKSLCAHKQIEEKVKKRLYLFHLHLLIFYIEEKKDSIEPAFQMIKSSLESGFQRKILLPSSLAEVNPLAEELQLRLGNHKIFEPSITYWSGLIFALLKRSEGSSALRRLIANLAQFFPDPIQKVGLYFMIASHSSLAQQEKFLSETVDYLKLGMDLLIKQKSAKRAPWSDAAQLYARASRQAEKCPIKNPTIEKTLKEICTQLESHNPWLLVGGVLDDAQARFEEITSVIPKTATEQLLALYRSVQNGQDPQTQRSILQKLKTQPLSAEQLKEVYLCDLRLLALQQPNAPMLQELLSLLRTGLRQRIFSWSDIVPANRPSQDVTTDPLTDENLQSACPWRLIVRTLTSSPKGIEMLSRIIKELIFPQIADPAQRFEVWILTAKYCAIQDNWAHSRLAMSYLDQAAECLYEIREKTVLKSQSLLLVIWELSSRFVLHERGGKAPSPRELEEVKKNLFELYKRGRKKIPKALAFSIKHEGDSPVAPAIQEKTEAWLALFLSGDKQTGRSPNEFFQFIGNATTG